MISRPLPTGVRKSRAFDQVALIQVVGPDRFGDQLVHQGPLDMDAIVDTGKEHGLVAHGEPGLERRSTARETSGVISLGWLKWRLIHSG